MNSELQLSCRDKILSFDSPKVMGILNLTPDSFADGGKYHSKELALQRVAEMVEEGADIIDIGAESSRPFSQRVSLQQEIDRLLEILVAVKERFDVILSVDTYKAEVMKEAIKTGVHIINDIYALRKPNTLEIIAQSNVAVCLMHMQGQPETMQDNPTYGDVVEEVSEFLQDRIAACLTAGIDRERIIIDPGYGFGKTTQHNLRLLRNLDALKQLRLPILVGLSRKFSIGELLSAPVEDRLYGSLAAHVIATFMGASIIRTHDVKPTVDALKITQAVIYS